MSRQAEDGLPEVVDGLAFAKDGATASGLIEISVLTRLAASLNDSRGRLECRLAGSRDSEGKSWLALEIFGTLSLVCQRCLAPMAFPVDISARLLLVPPGQAWPDDELAEDGFDAIAAEKEMVLLSLIEDEVLLALPIAPMHDSCVTSAPTVDEHELSPFAVLAELKKGV